jgi:hypothetical protein
VDSRDRARVERVAGEAVEAVGRKDGDAAGDDATFQFGPRRIRSIVRD